VGTSSSNIIVDAAANATIIGSPGNTSDGTISNADLVLSAPTTQSLGGNLIIDTAGTSIAYGTFENITFDEQLGQTTAGEIFTFYGNAININGNAYGISNSFSIDVNDGASSFITNHLNLHSQTLYGTGTLYGDFATLNLNSQSGAIDGNTFTFNGNNLTGAYYNPASQTLTGGTTAANLYAGIGTLVLTGNESNNTFTFGNSTLAALGTANFYNDIADFSGSPFYSSINITSAGISVGVKDGKGDVINFGNDTFNGTATGGNTFNFTLLNTSDGKIVGQGNTLITNFNATKDILAFNLTPSLYAALENSNKTMSASSFANGVSFNPINSTTDPTYSTLSGTVINFNGAGSITLENIPGLVDFSGLKTSFSINYADNNMTAITPTSIPVYGSGSNAHALDQFFTQSLFATYTTTGLPSGVTIDQYGNITVTNHDATFANVTITATSSPVSFNTSLNQGSTASQTVLMGFLNAPSETTASTSYVGTSSSNIIVDTAANATITGSNGENPTIGAQSNTSSTYGGNLIVDTQGGSTVYGDYQSIDYTIINSSGASNLADKNFSGNTSTFYGNAFDVTTGTVYGDSKTLTITVKGDDNITDKGPSADTAGANFTNNVYTFDPQIFYGGTSTYGNFFSFNIDLTGGQGNTAKGQSSLAVQSNFTGNTFTFDSNSINLTESGSSLSVNGNMNSFIIDEQGGKNNQGSIDASTNASQNTFKFLGNNIDIRGTGAGVIVGNTQDLGFSAQGTTDDVQPGTGSIPALKDVISSNLVDFSSNMIFSKITSPVYGNAQTIYMDAAGGTNIYSAGTSIIRDNENVNSNTIKTAGNTITTSGDAYGMSQNISLHAVDGFYSAASGSIDSASISNNTFQAGGNTLTGNIGSSEFLYGDAQIISLTINSSANSGGALTEASDFSTAVLAANTATPGSASVYEGNSVIDNNIFTFSSNHITGGDIGSNIFLGIDRLVMLNNEQTLNNASQPTASSIIGNHYTFGDSIGTATGGLTEFYSDINDLSQTNFDKYGVSATTTAGHVQVTDIAGTGNDSTIHGNIITFGNDTMNLAASGANVVNTDLLATTSGDGVAEGNTTINNFGTPGSTNENILDIHLSQNLYNLISAANNGATSITGAMLDSYFTGTGHETITTSGNNTTIHFSDAAHDNLGSLTFNGSTFTTFANLGTNLEVTANGITTETSTASSSSIFNAAISGNSIASYTQNLHLLDFNGELRIDISNNLFKALGMSDTNTAAQNAQILLNDANTSTGGVAASISGGNTILTFESTQGTYGSITLHNAAYTAPELVNHLLVSHA
jgi:hypothetical protein